jgi:hypothetical protein
MSAAVGGTQKVRAVVLGTLDQVRGSPAAHACWQHCIHLLRRMQDGIVVSARYCSFSAGWQSDHYCTLFGCFRELKVASQYPHADGSTSLKTVIGKSPAPSPPVGEHTENPTFQAVRGIGFRIARASSRKCFGIRCEADLQAPVLIQPLSMVPQVLRLRRAVQTQYWDCRIAQGSTAVVQKACGSARLSRR